MTQAFISDIHGNWESLTAVLDDISGQSIEKIYCLGDMVGYGPNPRECLREIQKIAVCILGNHDEAVISDPDPDEFAPPALKAALWTRNQLSDEDIGFIRSIPRFRDEDCGLLVHGSPNAPTDGYVLPMDINDPVKMATLFRGFDHYCLQGHTHMPGIFTISEFRPSRELDQPYTLDARKTMVNVGSVGQPRDGDSRACYAILKDEKLIFRRVQYDLETTVDKIYRVQELDNSFGDRLRNGS